MQLLLFFLCVRVLNRSVRFLPILRSLIHVSNDFELYRYFNRIDEQ